MTLTRRTVHPLLATLVAGALVACSSGTAGSTGGGLDSRTTSTQTATASPSPAAPTDAGAPAAGTPAAAAWEALMSPDGEYAASAAYAAVIEEYGGVEPYVSIRTAEERHIAALTRQLTRLGVDVPENPWLGRIAAPASLKEAAQAWADGEVANVALYDDLMAQASGDANLTRVFTNLRRASQESHLPMFRAAAAADGTLSASEVAGMEQHGSNGAGH